MTASCPVVLYYTLTEPEGALEAGSIAQNTRPERLVVTQVGAGGTLAFGTPPTGPAPAGTGTEPMFSRVDGSNGLILRTALVEPVTLVGDQNLELEAFLSTTQTEGMVAMLSDGSSSPEILFFIGVQGGFAVAQINGNRASASVPLSSAPTHMDNGALHHIAAKASLSGSTLTLRLLVDGVLVATSAGTAWPTTSFSYFTRLDVGGFAGSLYSAGATTLVAMMFHGTIAHVAVRAGTVASDDARFMDHWLARTTGFAGERSDQRIRRYARLAGIPDAEMNF